MSKTVRIGIEFVLATGCLIFIILFVLQIQNTQQTQDELQLSQLEGTGAALKGIMVQTQAAEDVNDANIILTQSAQEAITAQAQLVNDSQSTATQSAQEVATTEAQLRFDSQSTATQSAQLLHDLEATQTQIVHNAPVSSIDIETTLTQSASDFVSLQGTATQSMNFIQATKFALGQEVAQINATVVQASIENNQAQTQVAIHQEEIEALNNTIQEQATEIAFYLSDVSSRIDGSQTLVTDKYELILPDGFVGYDITGDGTEKAVEAMTALGPYYEVVSFMTESGLYSAIGLPITNRTYEFLGIFEATVLVPLSEVESMIPEILEGFQISYDTYVAQIYIANSEVNGLVFNQSTLRIHVEDVRGYYHIFYIMSDNTTTYTFWYMSEVLPDEAKIAQIDEAIAQNLTFNN